MLLCVSQMWVPTVSDIPQYVCHVYAGCVWQKKILVVLNSTQFTQIRLSRLNFVLPVATISSGLFTFYSINVHKSVSK